MTRDRPALLMTRPPEASERFVAMLGQDVALGTVVISPIMKISPTGAAPELTGVAGVIFSSAQAVQLFQGPTSFPAYCVGRQTTEAAKNRGFDAVFAGPTADALVQGLTHQPVPGPLLHLHGAHTRGEIAQRLSAAGQEVRSVVLYDQVAQPLSDKALKLLDGEQPVILPLFSPRSAALVCEQLRGRAPRWGVSLSENVAIAVPETKIARHVLASRPEAAAMCTAVAAFYRDMPPVEGGKGNA